MAEQIVPVSPANQVGQLIGDDYIMESAATVNPLTNPVAAVPETKFSGNIFEDFFSQAIKALEGISQQEAQANQLISQYVRGEADLQQVMVAQAKVSVQVQMAVTVITQAVTTFKEITQMQV